MSDLPDDERPRGLRSRFKTAMLLIATLGLCLAVTSVMFLPLVFPKDLSRAAAPRTDAGPPADAARKREISVQYRLPFFLAPDVSATAKQTVLIVCPIDAKEERANFGSGFLFRDGMVITAAHVVDRRSSEPPISVYCGGKRAEGKTVAFDDLRDVAVIKTDDCAASAIPFDTRKLDLDDELHESGFVKDDARTATKRYYGMTSPIPQAMLRPEAIEGGGTESLILAQRLRKMLKLGIPRYQALAGAAIPGQSGSPVFTDTGAIVGMIVTRDARHNRTYMVPAISIAQVLHDNGLD